MNLKASEKFIAAFLEDTAKLKIKPATLHPKATEHMGEIIDIVKKLEEKGIAYNVDGNVFFEVKKFDEYGKLSGKNVDDLESGARVEVNDEKNNPLDFALWKRAKENEPYWESPWGKGRPGWHIECSAMSMKHLGESIDIHMGGSDLIFPHHENEVAQSEACTGKEFVNYWIHFGFLNIRDEKMSKSLGNFYTAREIVNRFSPEVIRLFLSQSHYAGPLNFSEELLKSAQSGLNKITGVAKAVMSGIKANNTAGNKVDFDFDKFYKLFEDAMDDDLNTPKAVASIFDFVKAFNKTVAENKDINVEFYQKAKEFLDKTAEGVLGIIDYSEEKSESAGLDNELMELFIKLRKEAKADKNYALADKIRDELKEIGIELKDSKEGTSWNKI
ncbi:MAG: cysteine--tRNA ligase [Rhodothermaceae bacterium]